MDLATQWPQLAGAAIRAALSAGHAIMDVYGRDFAVDYKDDRSPLTEADHASHDCILERLRTTGIPVLSEESDAAPYAQRRNWPALWLVDPLDGTKEFIKRNGDFTVNIALIEEGRPTLGVVYVPAHEDLYFGVTGVGAYRATGEAIFQSLELFLADFPIVGKPFTALGAGDVAADPIRVVASRSHGTAATEAFMERLEACGRGVERISRGSALKLCMVASGEAHIYPRLAPTMEWDTAAAQAVVECAGGVVVVYDDAAHESYMKDGPAALFEARPLTYNRAELLNPWFVVLHPAMAAL